jgi:hypothetical protein
MIDSLHEIGKSRLGGKVGPGTMSEGMNPRPDAIRGYLGNRMGWIREPGQGRGRKHTKAWPGVFQGANVT